MILHRLRGRWSGAIMLGLSASMLTVVAACGNDSTPASAGTEQDPSTQPVTVDVTLKNFSIESTLTAFKAGVPYRFVVTNDSDSPHELMIMKPMPVDTTMDMEEMDEMAVAEVEEEDLPAGATQTLDLTFDKAYPAGTLEFPCHIPGHYELGMKLPVTVE